MRALSGLQPWWWWLFHGKGIENRVPASLAHQALKRYREPFLLHASKGVGALQDFDDACWSIGNIVGTEAFEAFRAKCLDVKYWGDCDSVFRPGDEAELPRGGIVGIARCAALITPNGHPWDLESKAVLERIKPDMRWHVPGQIGHVLVDVRPVPFVPCKGALGLWTVPDEVMRRVQLPGGSHGKAQA